MSLKKYSEEQIKKMSMMEVANIVLTEEKIELNFLDLFEKVADLKQFTAAQKEDLLARFYTDLNVDGRFSTIGSNKWGLKRWYPVDQTSEKALAESRKRDLDEEEAEEDNDDYVDEIDLLEPDLVDDEVEEDDMGFDDDVEEDLEDEDE